jgi:hypothetical protein
MYQPTVNPGFPPWIFPGIQTTSENHELLGDISKSPEIFSFDMRMDHQNPQ